ncbi:hypothetical protein [Erwinia sp. CGal63]|uniref:hypothetical protein n=1 Tax=Erwinia sp. CGal63 TaxID=2919889 RepID=UPI003009863E
MKLNIQHLQAAVALVIASLQPQAEAVVRQPMIVEKVYEMGMKVNKTDIRDLTTALSIMATEIRESRAELARCADENWCAAVTLAQEIKNKVVHLTGIAESFVLMLPEKAVMTAWEKTSVEFMFVKAIKMVSIAAKNYLSLIEQLERKTDVRHSDVDVNAMRHLLNTGNRAAGKWL